MAREFEINRKTIQDLIGSNVFFIPDFQRDFKWGEEGKGEEKDEKDEFSIFLNDLQIANDAAGENEYYIGTIITYEDENKEWQVIDGQQRLSSIIFLIAGYLIHLKKSDDVPDERLDLPRDLLKKKNWKSETNKRVLSTSDPYGQAFLDEFFELYSIPQKAINDQNIKEVVPNQLNALKLSVDFFDKNATQKRGKSDYNLGFINFILDNVVVAHVEALDFRKAFVVFERMNDRGRELSIPDKFKYLLMRQYSDTREEFEANSEAISTIWREIADKFNNDKNFTTFLMHYMAAFHFTDKWYSEDEIVSWFRVYGDGLDPYDLLEDLNEKADYYNNFIEGNDKNGKENLELKYKRRFFSAVKQVFPVLLATDKLTAAQFKQVCLAIMKLILVYQVNNENWQRIRTGKEKSILSFVKLLREKKVDKFLEEVNEIIEEQRKKFQQIIVSEDYFSDRSGIYDLRKYVILLIENLVRKESGQQVTFIDDVENSDDNTTKLVTLEHILPQNDSIDALSRSRPESYTDENEEIVTFSDQDITSLIGRLGNLVALDYITNSTIKDKTVAEKKDGNAYQLTTTAKYIWDTALSVKSSTNKYEKTYKKYHFEPIELEEINGERYFLLKQVIKREHIIFNILSAYLDVKLEHPQSEEIVCSYCK
tara:strand:+ start:1442 stop:3397 length:1956 start_codon:yes stop_codon:yes gene_type:complete